MNSSSAPYSGWFDGPVHYYAVRVYHEDTDASGVVYHATYLRWFERARSDMLLLLGIQQRSAIESGTGYYVVSDMAIRYVAPARLGDAVVVETRCEEAGAASIRMTQMALLDGRLSCEAKVRVGFVGPDGKPRRQPAEWRRAFGSILADTERK